MNKLIPYHIILAAKAGDKSAMDAILKHYEPMITQCSKRPELDEYGNTYEIVDTYMKSRIEAAVAYEILYNFDPTQLPSGETIED